MSFERFLGFYLESLTEKKLEKKPCESHIKYDQCSFKTESTQVSITSDETQTSSKSSTRKRSQRESMREHNPPVKGEGYDWSDLLPSYKKIMSNVAYVAMTGVLTANLGFVSVISIYGIQARLSAKHFFRCKILLCALPSVIRQPTKII